MRLKTRSLIIGSIALSLHITAIILGPGLLLLGLLFGGWYYYPNTFSKVFYLPIGIAILGEILGIIGVITFISEYQKSKRLSQPNPSLLGLGFSSLAVLPGVLALIYVGFTETPLAKPYYTGNLTLRSTRTPPVLPSVLSHLPASSAPLVASVQAWPVSLVR